MKTLKADSTILVTGWFRKRFWLIVPFEGVYELPVTTVKDLKNGKGEVKQNG